MNNSDTELVPGTHGLSPKTTSLLEIAVNKLSPEAINTIIATIRDIIQTNAILALKDQDFNHQFQELMAKHNNKRDMLRDLSTLLSNPKLPEQSVSQIVTTICRIAESVNG